MLCLGLERTLSWYKNDVDWFISVLGIALSCYMVVWIGVEEFLYKGNVVKNFQNPCFCFRHHSFKFSDSNLWVN